MTITPELVRDVLIAIQALALGGLIGHRVGWAQAGNETARRVAAEFDRSSAQTPDVKLSGNYISSGSISAASIPATNMLPGGYPTTNAVQQQKKKVRF